MNNKNKDFRITINGREDLEKPSLRDHSITIVKALLNAVPMVGGSLASLIDDYIPSQKEERLIDFTYGLQEKLTEVSNLIDEKYLRSDEFAYLFEQCYRNASTRYHKETLEALQAILVNSAVRFDTSQDIKEEFIRIAGELRPAHIKILMYFGDLYYYQKLRSANEPSAITEKDIEHRRGLLRMTQKNLTEDETNAKLAVWYKNAKDEYEKDLVKYKNNQQKLLSIKERLDYKEKGGNKELFFKDRIIKSIATHCLQDFDEGHIIALLNALISNGLITDPRIRDPQTFTIWEFKDDITDLGLLFLDFLNINGNNRA